MADDRYGGSGRREGWRERDSSIFSDDDDRRDRGSGRWSSEHGRGHGGDDDRGFFERAGDEVRSWFGDEDAERRRERDVRRDEARSAFGGRADRGDERGAYGFSTQQGGQSDWERGGRERAGWGRGLGGSSFVGGGSRGEQGGGRSQWDDNYRRWREQQLQQFDREYEDYCRERQQKFEQDFDSWRTSRLTEGGAGPAGATAQTGGGSATGYSGESSRGQSAASGSSGSSGSESAGTTSGGGGSGSAIGSSTGSTGAARETGSTVGAGETGGRGRGSRSRT